MSDPISYATASGAVLTPLSPQEMASGLKCGEGFSLGRLNSLLKLALERRDNAVVSASYNPGSNNLTFAMSDGPSVNIPLTPLIADAVATGLITSSSYNAATDILTLLTANGDQVQIPMQGVIADAVGGAVSPIPAGIITLWSGFSPPGGWALCDGGNGTPDLRNRFVVGAGGIYSLGSTGGSRSHGHSVNVPGHALTIAEMPAHSHHNGVVDDTGSMFNHGRVSAESGASETIIDEVRPATWEGVTGNAGDGAAHTHEGSSTEGADHTPPFYALAYIMKL